MSIKIFKAQQLTDRLPKLSSSNLQEQWKLGHQKLLSQAKRLWISLLKKANKWLLRTKSHPREKLQLSKAVVSSLLTKNNFQSKLLSMKIKALTTWIQIRISLQLTSSYLMRALILLLLRLKLTTWERKLKQKRIQLWLKYRTIEESCIKNLHLQALVTQGSRVLNSR